MKVLAVNGSPRGRDGNTERILGPFLEGMQEAGAETETVYLKEMRINHCLGCFSCWTATPGKCVHQDDMPELLAKLAEADTAVYATPLYCFTVTGLMKDFMDRSIPLATPAIEEQQGRYYHDSRHGGKGRRQTVLISNCGFPGRYNFAGLVETFEILRGGHLNGTILCTQGGLLHREDLTDLINPFLEAVRQAGREVAEKGCIAPETQAFLDRELTDPKTYQQEVNQHWKSLGV